MQVLCAVTVPPSLPPSALYLPVPLPQEIMGSLCRAGRAPCQEQSPLVSSAGQHAAIHAFRKNCCYRKVAATVSDLEPAGSEARARTHTHTHTGPDHATRVGSFICQRCCGPLRAKFEAVPGWALFRCPQGSRSACWRAVGRSCCRCTRLHAVCRRLGAGLLGWS